jgi:class 3 adenylate cyclase
MLRDAPRTWRAAPSEPRIRQNALAALLFGAWAICFALTLDSVVRRTGYAPLGVEPAAGPAAYPHVAEVSASAAAAGLAIGDDLLAVGPSQLAGGGVLAVKIAFAGFEGDAAVPVRYARGGAPGIAELRAGSYARFWPRLPASFAFAACAAFLLRRARPSRLVRVLVVTNLWSALFFACTFAGGPLETYASVGVHVVSLGLAAALGLRVVQLFPHDREPEHWAARLLPWPFAALAVFDASRSYALPFSREVGAIGSSALGLLYVATAFATVIRTYRRSSPIERRQIKWMLLGGYFAVLPFTALVTLAAFDPRFESWLAIAIVSLAIFPVFWIIGIVRFNWFDIDRLLQTAASYTLLLVLVLAGVLIAAPALASVISTSTGVSDGVARVALSIGLAAVLVPAHRQLGPLIDRLFFAERFALSRGIEALIARIGRCTSPESLAPSVGEELDQLLRPECCLVYARRGNALVPEYARGRAAPVGLSARGALVAALEERPKPVAGEAPGAPSGAWQRAILETLDIAMAVPVCRDGRLVALLGLGEKRSGDVYTATDRALLALVADRMASQTLHLEQDQALREGTAARERLRRYVPGSLAERLEGGQEVDLGEVEVSVLFVDLRGYSRYAEPLAPREIFSAISRYAEAVSVVVRERGGTVVEFAGDGLMAVFGAPLALERKEEAAVAAALAIQAAVRDLALPDGRRFAVGIGIATGPAFVGSIGTGDRLIWTALGNTTNLASRLQSMTRELEAGVIVDAATHARSGAAGARFTAVEKVAIRGRDAAETLYLLPLDAA